MAAKLVVTLEKANSPDSQVERSTEPYDRKFESFLRSIEASSYPHGYDRSLYDHLRGTRDILRCWSQPFWIQTAGLFHSIYSTDVYRRQVLDVSERGPLQDLIGKRAEHLVYLFHKSPRQRFFDRLFKFPSIPSEGLVVPLETSDKQVDFILEPSEVFGLIVVHMANEAEQACLPDGKPGVWLARVSELGTQLHKAKGLVPSVFDKCSIVVSLNDERQLSESNLKGFGSVPADLSAADTHFAKCYETCPWIAEPLILRAYLKTLAGDILGGCELSLQATKILEQWGTAWDKRLSWSEWKRLADVLLNQIEPGDVTNLSAEFLKEPRALFNRVAARPAQVRLFESPNTRSELAANEASAQSGLTRLEQYICSFADTVSDPRKSVYPELPSQPWHDPNLFPIVPTLEAAYDQIKEEVMRLHDEDFHQESETISRTGAWDVFFFYERGNKNVGNCARCPTITRIIEQHETLRTQAGLIYLSRLRSGTHISPHRGPTNVRVRCHLGIQVPDGDCRLRVGNEVGTWKEGRCIVFDDCCEHEAWNRTTEDRIVLIVDLWHPAFTPHEREIMKGLHHYAFAHAQSLHRYWIENLKAKFMIRTPQGNTRSAMHDYH